MTILLVLQDDVYTHLYTLIVRPDNTYEVKIDNKKVDGGDLESDWDFLAPKKIKVSPNGKHLLGSFLTFMVTITDLKGPRGSR